MNYSLIKIILSKALYKTLKRKIGRRTDFDMKATEPAEVVDVVTDVGEGVGCEEVFEDGEVGGLVGSVVTFDTFAPAAASALILLKTTATKSRIMGARYI
ncbi:unnamed protein product [Hymenolepis diminuta]|uniref:Uncharacterized protein n=1 Tax=Hymenolepis diminuta TaxID=6216 RepID=A0A564Y6I7_HYMDI|nr:unnamed protein product [Hymenolepis diminuta]